MFNGNRLTPHSYKTTQNLMVQGKTHEKFVTDILEPYFRKMIEKALDDITKFNEEVKNELGSKSSSKQKPTLTCQHCDLQATTTTKLRNHLKICHTKPEIKSP